MILRRAKTRNWFDLWYAVLLLVAILGTAFASGPGATITSSSSSTKRWLGVLDRFETNQVPFAQYDVNIKNDISKWKRDTTKALKDGTKVVQSNISATKRKTTKVSNEVKQKGTKWFQSKQSTIQQEATKRTNQGRAFFDRQSKKAKQASEEGKGLLRGIQSRFERIVRSKEEDQK